MEQLVEQAIAGFDPELLLVSAGFDAAAGDLLGGMRVTADGFAEMTRRAQALEPRVGFVLEGGYASETLPARVGAALPAWVRRAPAATSATAPRPASQASRFASATT